jgi:ubiquinone/menaquinone biosynthesis C-methylase UbiE
MAFSFDDFADAYDQWFHLNQNIFDSELRLVAKVLGEPGTTLSIGCGTGLFEQQLEQQHGIVIRDGVEPSADMAEVARRRGMNVRAGSAEALPIGGEACFDTVLFNGSLSYVQDLEAALREALRVVRPGGRVIMIDVPAEGGFGLLYRLGAAYGSWDDLRMQELAPAHPYPVELAASAAWRSTPEKQALAESLGLRWLASWQTLTVHPRYANDQVEEPTAGHERGDYVALVMQKPAENE